MGIFDKLMSDFNRTESLSEPSPSRATNKNFYLVSAAGMPNYGDDMLTRGWVNVIKRAWPNAHIYLDAVDPVVAQTLFPEVTCVNYFWTLAQALGTEGEIPDKFADPIMLPVRERLMLNLLPEMQSFHLTGGGYINDFSGANSRLIELIAFFADKFNIPCYATGLGLYPLSPEHAAKFKSAICKFEIFDVRDASSYEVLNALSLNNLSFVGDDYFSFPFNENVRLVESSVPSLRLCLSNESADIVNAEDKLLGNIDILITQFNAAHPDGQIIFYEFRPGVDGELYKTVKARHAKVTFVPFDILWTQGLTLSPNDYFISTRFHFQLIVASMGLKGISFYWNEYYRNKFSSLEEVTNWKSFNLDDESIITLNLSLDDIANNGLEFSDNFKKVREEKLKMVDMLYISE
ncbi:polysaccharide pyruvyl transferase family protein [Enterobacter sp. BRE11]|nr:polysaccharide pyruvyl transferase family protein [Enterobacter sp. BRE11]